jgi:hypothetical protein
LFGLFIIRWFHRRQTHRRENGATSVPRQHRSSNRHTGSFRSSHRVALRDSGRRAVGNADGPGERGVGTATRRASLPHNVARALDSEVVFRRVGPWGCPRFFFRPLRLSASWVYGAKFRFEQIGHSESLLDVRIAFRRCFLPRDNPRGGDNSPGGIRGCSPSMAATFLGSVSSSRRRPSGMPWSHAVPANTDAPRSLAGFGCREGLNLPGWSARFCLTCPVAFPRQR